jgi:hypothetical protein
LIRLAQAPTQFERMESPRLRIAATNCAVRGANAFLGSRSPRSQRANVLWSTPILLAASFCEIPNTDPTNDPMGAEEGVEEADHRRHVIGAKEADSLLASRRYLPLFVRRYSFNFFSHSATVLSASAYSPGFVGFPVSKSKSGSLSVPALTCS